LSGPPAAARPRCSTPCAGFADAGFGRIRWHGREVSGQPQNVGYMLQKDLLLPWADSARQTPCWGWRSAALRRGEAQDRSHAMLDQLGLTLRRSLSLDPLGWNASAAWRWPGTQQPRLVAYDFARLEVQRKGL